MSDDIEWPREIWMAERQDHNQGLVRIVLSEHATIPRYEGDTERDREFRRYVDGDIYKSAERYHKARLETLTAERDALKAEVERLQGVVEAAETKALLWGGGVCLDAL